MTKLSATRGRPLTMATMACAFALTLAACASGGGAQSGAQSGAQTGGSSTSSSQSSDSSASGDSAASSAAGSSTSGDSASSANSAASNAGTDSAASGAASQSGAGSQSGTARADEPVGLIGTGWAEDLAAPVVGEANLDDPLILSDVRVSEHDGFDRVVVEFAGSGKPGWMVNWTQEAVSQGKGEVLNISKPEILDLVVTETAWPSTEEQQGKYYKGEAIKKAGGLEVHVDGTFEANTHIAIGMDGRARHQIGILENPLRVVVDVEKK